MPNENDFSGIPSLDDTQGLQDYLTTQTVSNLGVNPIQQGDGQAQAQTQTPTSQDGQQPGVQAQPQAQGAAQPQTYTSDQVAAIIRQTMAMQSRQQQQQQQHAGIQGAQPAAARGYTPQQQQAIINALQRGMTLEQIQAALSGASADMARDAAMQRRMANIEQQLANQEYQREQNAFIDKCVAFGNKWGLSEQDLVTFGNVALSKGINIAQVPDLEVAFRAVFPEQYAVRAQRMQPNPTSQIYGGTSTSEGTSAASQKAVDMYVESFLKQAMPNQYKSK